MAKSCQNMMQLLQDKQKDTFLRTGLVVPMLEKTMRSLTTTSDSDVE